MQVCIQLCVRLCLPLCVCVCVCVCVLWCWPSAVWSNSSWQAGLRPLSRVLSVCLCMCVSVCVCPALVVCANWKLSGTGSRSSVVPVCTCRIVHILSRSPFLSNTHTHTHTQAAQQQSGPLAFLHLTWVQSAASSLIHPSPPSPQPPLACTNLKRQLCCDLPASPVSLDIRNVHTHTHTLHQVAVQAFREEEKRRMCVINDEQQKEVMWCVGGINGVLSGVWMCYLPGQPGDRRDETLTFSWESSQHTHVTSRHEHTCINAHVHTQRSTHPHSYKCTDFKDNNKNLKSNEAREELESDSGDLVQWSLARVTCLLSELCFAQTWILNIYLILDGTPLHLTSFNRWNRGGSASSTSDIWHVWLRTRSFYCPLWKGNNIIWCFSFN